MLFAKMDCSSSIQEEIKMNDENKSYADKKSEINELNDLRQQIGPIKSGSLSTAERSKLHRARQRAGDLILFDPADCWYVKIISSGVIGLVEGFYTGSTCLRVLCVVGGDVRRKYTKRRKYRRLIVHPDRVERMKEGD
jgi:hypothetical protein